MSDDFKMQLSICIPSGEQYEKGHMVNIRANNPEEFQAMLGWTADHADKIGEAIREVRSVAIISDGLGGSVVRHESPAQEPQNGSGGSSWGSGSQQTGQRSGGFSGPQNGSGGGQAQAQSLPPHAGTPPNCIHGTRTYLRKPYKNGNPGYWEAWACPSKDRNDQCDLDFFPKKGR